MWIAHCQASNHDVRFCCNQPGVLSNSGFVRTHAFCSFVPCDTFLIIAQVILKAVDAISFFRVFARIYLQVENTL